MDVICETFSSATKGCVWDKGNTPGADTGTSERNLKRNRTDQSALLFTFLFGSKWSQSGHVWVNCDVPVHCSPPLFAQFAVDETNPQMLKLGRFVVANFPQNVSVNESRKSVNICWSYSAWHSGTFFETQCRSWTILNRKHGDGLSTHEKLASELLDWQSFSTEIPSTYSYVLQLSGYLPIHPIAICKRISVIFSVLCGVLR